MPINVPGVLVSIQLLFYPRLALPNLIVKDIRHIDFTALKAAGYRGAVFDKDNCITRPHKDTIVPEIQSAWDECRKTFGEGNVLIVSNSAGTWLDPGGIQCESVTYNTGVPVLRHKTFKPAYSCITAIRTYFSSLRSPIRDEELIIVGDRIFTDIIMANRMRRWKNYSRTSQMVHTRGRDDGGAAEKEEIFQNQPNGPLAIWTTGIWQRDSRAMRWGEQKLVDVVRRWTGDSDHEIDTGRFIKDVPTPEIQSVKRNRVLTLLLDKFKTG